MLLEFLDHAEDERAAREEEEQLQCKGQQERDVYWLSWTIHNDIGSGVHLQVEYQASVSTLC